MQVFHLQGVVESVNSDLGRLEGFPELTMYKQSVLYVPAHNLVSGLSLGRKTRWVH